MRALSLLVFVLLAPPAFAQSSGNCAPSTGEGFLDVGNVLARIPNNGMVTSGGLARPIYEVPKGSGHDAVHFANLLVGVEVEGDFKVAATTTGPAEFWSGPLDHAGAAPDLTHCQTFDRVWNVRREDLERFKRSGLTTEALEAWPHQIGAPVADGDGVPGNYNLMGGDLPAILGDQTIWWVMNDRGNAHRYTDSEPTGLEIRSEAFAFGSSGILGNSTFYRYEIQNRTADSLTVFPGLFLAGSSGALEDDYAGTDTSLAMAYFYGADDEDEVFGTRPPALGVTVLKAPVVDGRERRLGASHIPFDDGGPYGWPSDAPGYRNFVRGLMKNGDAIREGSRSGAGIGRETPFVFSGDPVSGSFWSMVNPGPNGSLAPPFGQELFVFLEPFPLPPREVEVVVFALVWAQGDNRFDSIVRLREGVRLLQNERETLLTRYAANDGSTASFVLGLADNYPNPFRTRTRIRASIPRRAVVRLEVFDALGRSVAMLQNGDLDKGEHSWELDGQNLTSGVYAYRLSVDGYNFSKTMVLAR